MTDKDLNKNNEDLIMPEDALDKIREIRAELDEIDRDILTRVKQRQVVGSEIYRYKAALGLPIADPSRDVMKIASVDNGESRDISLAQAGIQRTLLRNNDMTQFRQAMAEDRNWDFARLVNQAVTQAKSKQKNQSRKLVACLATGAGTYSEAALALYPDAAVVPVRSLSSAFKQLKEEAVDIAILPVDNLATGGMPALARNLKRHGLYIVGDITMPLYHRLLVLPGTRLADIRKVFGSAEALERSAKLIKNMGWNAEEVGHAAIATRVVTELKDPSLAALASVDAGESYNLQMIEADSSPMQVGQSRFIALAKQPLIQADAGTLSVIIRLSHQSGALLNALSGFAHMGINLKQVYSMTVEGKPWEYEVYLEIHAKRDNMDLMTVLYGMDHDDDKELTFLGWYRSVTME